MLSAMTAFVTATTTGSVLLGFAAGAAVGALMALVIAFSSIELRLNQIAVGFVLTLLGIRLSSFIGNPFVGRQGHAVPHLGIPGLERIPVIGPIFFDHNLSVYGSYLVPIGAYLFLYRTRRGLELQAVGERPEAAFARGVDVNRVRYVATVVGGALAGVGGAAVSLRGVLGGGGGVAAEYRRVAPGLLILRR